MAIFPFNATAAAVSRRFVASSTTSVSSSVSSSSRYYGWILVRQQQQQKQRQCFFPASRFLSTTSTTATTANKKLLSKDEMNRIAIIRLYRILQRTCTYFPTSNSNEGNDENENDVDDPIILLQPQLDVRGWGYHSIFIPNRPTMTEELFRLFYIWNTEDDEEGDDDDDIFSSEGSTIDDWYNEVVEKTCSQDNGLPPLQSTKTCWTTKSQLKDAIRQIFRINYDDDKKIEKSKLLKWSIKAIQILQQQQSIWRTSSVTTTNPGIRVTATSRFVGPTSRSATLPPSAVPGTSMLDTKYSFAYRIRVENLSDQHVQLLGRYWHIQETDDNDVGESYSRQPIIVDQPNTGAVGQLPVLRPGQVFEYMSGVELATSTGIMKGHFYMAKVSHNIKSAKSGDDVEAIRLKNQEPIIEVAIGPFPLRVVA